MEPLRPSDPRRIGPYEVRARLGSGGMGQVFLGRSRSGREVAIKLVQEGFASDPEFRARFRREVTAAQAVSGAFTAPVLDADPEAPVPWLATAYLPGLSLQQAVAAHGPLPVPSTYVLGANLAEALVAIHKAGVVHRDLKPSNVLLTPDGPRVIDFGVARAVDATAVTMTGSIIGSPGYMAPEQAAGGETGPAGDVFALGGVLTYALTGRGPFGNGTAETLIYRILHEEPDLSGVDDPVLRDLITACLDKAPDRRPAPEDILTRLSALSSAGATTEGTDWLPRPIGEDVLSRTAVLPPEPGPSRRSLLTAAGGVVVLGVAAFGATRYLLRRERDPEPETGRSTPSASPSLPAGVLWRRRIAQAGSMSSVIAFTGNMIFAEADNGIKALDAESGDVLWQAETRPTSLRQDDFRPLVRDGIAYLQDGTAITAYDAVSGRVRWTHPLESLGRHAWPVAVAGSVVGASDGEVIAYDPVTGDFRWKWSSSSHLRPTLVAADGAVLAMESGSVVSLDGRSGRKRWEHERDTADDFLINGAVLADGRIFVTQANGTVLALDVATGRLRWRAGTGRGRMVEAGTTVAARTVYAQGPDERLYAIDAESGKRRWKVELAGNEAQQKAIEIIGLKPVTAIGLVYVNDCNGNLLALDNGTGRIRWRQAIPYTPGSAVPVIAGGAIHITTGGKDVRSFDLATGRILRVIPLDHPGALVAGKDVLYVREGKSLAALRPDA